MLMMNIPPMVGTIEMVISVSILAQPRSFSLSRFVKYLLPLLSLFLMSISAKTQILRSL